MRVSRNPAGAALAAALIFLASGFAAEASEPAPRTVEVFRDAPIRFAPAESTGTTPRGVPWVENGRVIASTVDLEPPPGPYRIYAQVALRPVPKDEQTVADKWDRAGDVRLVREGEPDAEIVKFVTSYGGATGHEVEVTELAPLLRGRCTIEGFVDTWVDPAWRMDVSLTFVPDSAAQDPDWCLPVAFEPSVTRERMDAGPLRAAVTVPAGLTRVALEYLVSGHCTDGVDADEFISKDNVIAVDGTEGLRFRPWRADCRDFRPVNPYCRRWSDGTWSCDYSRSGWCPGDKVLPVEADLTGLLPAGGHVVTFRVEDVRPKGADGNYGYWRVSGYLVGWR